MNNIILMYYRLTVYCCTITKAYYISLYTILGYAYIPKYSIKLSAHILKYSL